MAKIVQFGRVLARASRRSLAHSYAPMPAARPIRHRSLFAIPPSTIVRMPLRRSWRSSFRAVEGPHCRLGDADIARFCEPPPRSLQGPLVDPAAGSGVG